MIDPFDEDFETVSAVRLGSPIRALLDNLGPLKELPGDWKGKGFNLIARPHFRGSDHFLELNLTGETLRFDLINAPIPNRGLLQPDINLFGLHYLQQISDSFTLGSLHIEPGIWVNIPKTKNPAEEATVARMATIPHGNALVAQGAAAKATPGPPQFDPVDPTPFDTASGAPVVFREYTLADASPFRTHPLNPEITQAMVTNPNSVLAAAIAGQTIEETLKLEVSTASGAATVPNAGGGVENIAFLETNANAAQMKATFWIEKVRRPHGLGYFMQLQYSQTVLLNFNGRSWPHISVATLRK